MPRIALAYICTVLLMAGFLSFLTLPLPDLPYTLWIAFATLSTLAAITQLMVPTSLSRRPAGSYHPCLVFFSAALFLLPPILFVALVLITTLLGWAGERRPEARQPAPWYLRPVHTAVHLIAGLSAHYLYGFLLSYGIEPPLMAMGQVTAALLAVILYLLIDHLLMRALLLLLHHRPPQELPRFQVAEGLPAFVTLYLGFAAAVLWQMSPWFILPALFSFLLLEGVARGRVEQESPADSRMDLLPIRRFTQLAENELQRTRRFNRSLSILVADCEWRHGASSPPDSLLREALLADWGGMISEVIRPYDLASRMEGKKFCLMLPETELNEAREIAQRLHRAITQAHAGPAASFGTPQLAIHIGIAHYPTDGGTAAELIQLADAAAYRAREREPSDILYACELPHSARVHESECENLGQAGPLPKGKGPTAPTTRKGFLLPLYVSLVSLAGFLLLLSPAMTRPLDWPAIVLLFLLALTAELLQVNLCGGSTFSVSVAFAFAAALITGLPGVAIISGAIVLGHWLKARPLWYKSLFNWSTHLMAGFIPVLASSLFDRPLHVAPLGWLLPAMLAAALLHYTLSTLLIMGAIALSTGLAIGANWRNHYGWILPHYLVLCGLGLFLALAYQLLGLPSILIFAVPIFMMRYAQEQYVEQTRGSIQELHRMNQELAQANTEVHRASDTIHQLNDELFLILGEIIDVCDPFVSGHANQVARYAVRVALALDVPAEQVEVMRLAALLHDIGKIAIPEEILNRPGRLTKQEYEIMKHHAEIGARLLERVQSLCHLAPAVRHHHERWDGRGYPSQLKGEAIPLEARILAVCDAVEAMASDRPYQQAMAPHEIIQELARQASRQFDPLIVQTFIRVVEEEGEAFIVNSAQDVASRQQLDGGRAGVPSGHPIAG